MLRGLLFAATLVAVTLWASVRALTGSLFGASREWYDRGHRRWAEALLRVSGVEVRVEGEEGLSPGEALVLACNHRSLFDILALFAGLPLSVRFVAKAELARIPLFASGCRKAGHVFIQRGRAGEAIAGIREAGRSMRDEGLAVAIFPEGTRSPDGRLLPFKSAPFLLAIESGTPVVPVAIEGTGAVLPKGEWRVRPGTVTLRVGRPRETRGLGPADRRRLAEEVRAEVERLLEEGGSEVETDGEKERTG